MANPAEDNYTVPDAADGLPDQPLDPGPPKPIDGRTAVFRIWTGQDPALEIMSAAALHAVLKR